MSDPHTNPCCEFGDRIADMHDGRVEVGSCDCEEIQKHLESCEQCSSLLEDFRAMNTALEILREGDIPKINCATTRNSVRSKLRARHRRGRMRWWALGVGFAAAASLLVVMDFSKTTNPNPTEIPPLAVKMSPQELERRYAIVDMGNQGTNIILPEVIGIEQSDIARLGFTDFANQKRHLDGLLNVGIGAASKTGTSTDYPSVRAKKPSLGAVLMSVRTQDRTPCVLVVGVCKCSPAEESGLKPGDIIIRINGQNLDGNILTAGSIIQKAAPKSDVKLGVIRGGKKLQLLAKLRSGAPD